MFSNGALPPLVLCLCCLVLPLHPIPHPPAKRGLGFCCGSARPLAATPPTIRGAGAKRLEAPPAAPLARHR